MYNIWKKQLKIQHIKKEIIIKLTEYFTIVKLEEKKRCIVYKKIEIVKNKYNSLVIVSKLVNLQMFNS